MGRTQRRRSQKKQCHPSKALDHEEAMINLRQFMSRHNFVDKIHLQLRNFSMTGRGLSSKTNLKANDILITVPFDLMITYQKLRTPDFLHLFNSKAKLPIHDLLATFLVLEKHKSHSFWSDYINSLPFNTPWLPALLSDDGIELLPFDLRLDAKKSRRRLQESWSRLRKSIEPNWTCECCGKEADCVIEQHSYTWAYILVNTRAVYVNPALVGDSDDWTENVLSDEPSMALCPLLDMFNHSPEAKTNAELICQQGELVYQLTTLTASKKYEQVFISYGDHSNEKLLTEYGFFVPMNRHDCVVFQNDHIFRTLRLNLDSDKYKFLNKHNLNTSLWFDEFGPSFNLKALLYVACGSSDLKNFAKIIFNGSYSTDFLNRVVREMCSTLLRSELQRTETILKLMRNADMQSLIIDFLHYKLELIKTFCLRNSKFNYTQ